MCKALFAKLFANVRRKSDSAAWSWSGFLVTKLVGSSYSTLRATVASHADDAHCYMMPASGTRLQGHFVVQEHFLVGQGQQSAFLASACLISESYQGWWKLAASVTTKTPPSRSCGIFGKHSYISAALATENDWNAELYRWDQWNGNEWNMFRLLLVRGSFHTSEYLGPFLLRRLRL